MSRARASWRADAIGRCNTPGMDSLPQSVQLGQVIALRRFTLRGTKKKVELRIGLPVALEQDAYCPVQLVGIGPKKVQPVFGVDTMQALQLALRQCERLAVAYSARLPGTDPQRT